MKGKKQQFPANHSFCYFQPTPVENQAGNHQSGNQERNHSVGYDAHLYCKTLDRTKDKGNRKSSSRMKKSESLREKLSCVGSHSTDSFDRRNVRTNLNEYLSEVPPSYFQQLLKTHNQSAAYPPAYSCPRPTRDKGHKKLVYADLALANHNMKFKNTVHSNRQLYGNFAPEPEFPSPNGPGSSHSEEEEVKYNEIDV